MFDKLKAINQVMHDAKRPRSELEQIVNKRLKAVLISAYSYVPYYRELMQSVDYNPLRNYRGLEDLSRLPITTKRILKQKEITSLVSDSANLNSYYYETTSGSTGIPFMVYRSSYERAIQIAKWLRVLFMNGYSVFDKVMSLTSPTRVNEGRSIIQYFGILRRHSINYLLPIEEIVDRILVFKPRVLYGDRSLLDLIALEMKRRGIQAEGLKLVIATGEVIYRSSRKLSWEQFGVGLRESYGSVEMGVMAYETAEYGGLHLCEDLTYFEFLNQVGKPVAPGEPGRVIVTDLTGKLMPFIRYDQGDTAIFKYEDNRSNRISRKITRIIGREDDYAVLPDGTTRPYHDFYELMSEYEGIDQFRIVQQERTLFKILVVTDNSYFRQIHDDLLGQLQHKFPQTVNFEIVRTDRMEPDPSGKIRMLISEVTDD